MIRSTRPVRFDNTPPLADSRALLTVLARSGGSEEPAAAWAAYGIETPADTGGDGWFLAICPKCDPLYPNDPAASPSASDQGERRVVDRLRTLRTHHSGVFLCARCGWHGDARRSFLAGSGTGLAGDGRPPFLPAWWQADTTLNTLTPMARALGVSPDLLTSAGASIGSTWFPDGAVAQGVWTDAVFLPCYRTAENRTEPPVIVDVLAVRIDPSGDPWDITRRLPGGTPIPWGWDRVEADAVVFVDHPLDRLALLEAGVASVACLPNEMHPYGPGGGDWSCLGSIEADIGRIGKIVLAFRDHRNGHALEEELARRVGREKCFRVRWSQPESESRVGGSELESGRCAKSAMDRRGAEYVRQRIAEASPYPVAGIHELLDVEERLEVLYEFGLARGVSTGWPTVDLHYTVKPGQITTVTGIPGHGKSNWVDDLFVNLARENGWTFGVFSPENQPIERHFAGLMEKYVGAAFNTGPSPRITGEEKNAAKAWLNRHFKIILPDEIDGNWTLDAVLSLAKMLVYRYGIRGLVIDPWNEMDHSRAGNVTEADHVSACLTRIRRFSRLHGVHVWIVAHPLKLEPKADGKYPVPTPYMISGGANWRNKSDNVIAIYRNVGEDDEDVCDIHVQKIRFKEIGRVGLVSLRCDPVCGRYIDDIDQVKRRRAMEKGLHLPSVEVRVGAARGPAWTRRDVIVGTRPDRGMPMDFEGDGLPSLYD